MRKVFSDFTDHNLVFLYNMDKYDLFGQLRRIVNGLQSLPMNFYTFDIDKNEIPHFDLERLAGSVLYFSPHSDAVHMLDCTKNLSTSLLLRFLYSTVPEWSDLVDHLRTLALQDKRNKRQAKRKLQCNKKFKESLTEPE